MKRLAVVLVEALTKKQGGNEMGKLYPVSWEALVR